MFSKIRIFNSDVKVVLIYALHKNVRQVASLYQQMPTKDHKYPMIRENIQQ